MFISEGKKEEEKETYIGIHELVLQIPAPSPPYEQRLVRLKPQNGLCGPDLEIVRKSQWLQFEWNYQTRTVRGDGLDWNAEFSLGVNMIWKEMRRKASPV